MRVVRKAISRANDRLMSQRRRHPKPDRRRALELLASCRGGCTEAIMLAHGFTIEVARVRITEAGDGCSRD
jgi:hypothetical protein